MIRHFIQIYFRTLRRQWQYSLINLIGLAIGLAASILILLYVFNELSYDRFHQNSDQLWRIILEYKQQDNAFSTPTIPAAVGPSLHENFPEIKGFCRTRMPDNGYLLTEKKAFKADQIIYADSSFFKLFSFNLIMGDPAKALSGLNKVVLSSTMAKNMFEDTDPIGKLVRLNGNESWIVSGVAENAPPNSSIKFDVLLSFETLYTDSSLQMGWLGGNQYQTFVLTNNQFDQYKFNEKLPDFLDEKINSKIESSGFSVSIKMEALKNMHLRSVLSGNTDKSFGNLHIFTLVALFILLIACFNFTSLATASAIRRAKETGIKKVLGAKRSQLIIQYLSESVLMSLIAFGLSLLLIELIIPSYNALIGKNLHLWNAPLSFIYALLLLVLLTGIIAGIYPAFYLSSFSPVKALKGGFNTAKKRHLLPKTLLLLQFLAASVLVSSSWIIHSQLQYLKAFDKGFKSDHVIRIALPSEGARNAIKTLKQNIIKLPGIIACGAVTDLPGAGVSSNGYTPEGYEKPVMIHVIDIDEHALEVFDIEIIEGRNFSHSAPTDKEAYLVNETFVKHFGYANPIGKTIKREGNYPIIGVVKDFHFNSLRQTVKPLILTMHPWDGYYYLIVRTEQLDPNTIIPAIEKIWREFLPNDPFIANSFNTYLEEAYQDEKRLGALLGWFTVLGLLIAAMGLFGLSGLMINQQLKTLGIRKILGASNLQLLLVTSGNFTLLVIFANALAIIPVWLIMQNWLANFSEHISISGWFFLITTVFSLLLAWISIGWMAWRANHIKLIDIITYE